MVAECTKEIFEPGLCKVIRLCILWRRGKLANYGQFTRWAFGLRSEFSLLPHGTKK